MRKEGQISTIVLLSILFVVILGLFVYTLVHIKTFESPLFSPIGLPGINLNCSSANFSILWQNVINESYTGVVTKFNSTLCKFEGVKYTDLTGFDDVFYLENYNVAGTNRSVITFGYYQINDTENNLTLNITEYQAYNSNLPTYLFNNLGFNVTYKSLPINTSQKAVDESQARFKIDTSNLSKWTDNPTNYGFLEGVQVVGTESDSLVVYKNITKEEGTLQRVLAAASPPVCTPNVTLYNTTCQTDETFTQYPRDPNYCNQTLPANTTFYCDYNGNGLIVSTISTQPSSLLTIYINNATLNSSQNYSGNRYKIDLRTVSNVSIITFNWTFSQSPVLDLHNLYVEKQSSSPGYLFIKGIPTNKIILVDRINSTSQLCVRNSELSSISSLSTSCSNSGEFLLDCPGSSSSAYNVSCIISGSYDQVSGLTSSAVREYIPSSGLCSPLWNCTNWTSCVNNLQTKTCVDRNSCNTTAGRPALNQSCVSPITPACVTNWTCTSWTTCANGNQTRTCTDRNHCGTTTNKPLERQSCEIPSPPSSSNVPLIIIISVLIALSLGVVITIFLVLNRDRNSTPKVDFRNNPQPPPSEYVGYR